ncbi:MAG: hypothetical protein PHC60_02420 [Heliobacteriaceae bacterium]|nr:hypothetical protein [Heliobacteriaceae bacterium]MDD4587234.1 hypothetical protein [Heliobacteriaceae bacterium]
MISGIILAVAGISVMLVGLVLMVRQQRQKSVDLQRAEKISVHLVEAKLVQRDMENLLTRVTEKSTEVVNLLHAEVAVAQETITAVNDTITMIKDERQSLQAEHKQPVAAATRVGTKPAGLLRVSPPYPLQKYRQMRNRSAKASARETNPLAKGEKIISRLGRGEPRYWTRELRYEQIPHLELAGLTETEIAQLLDLGQGEVQLAIQLRRKLRGVGNLEVR